MIKRKYRAQKSGLGCVLKSELMPFADQQYGITRSHTITNSLASSFTRNKQRATCYTLMSKMVERNRMKQTKQARSRFE